MTEISSAGSSVCPPDAVPVPRQLPALYCRTEYIACAASATLELPPIQPRERARQASSSPSARTCSGRHRPADASLIAQALDVMQAAHARKLSAPRVPLSKPDLWSLDVYRTNITAIELQAAAYEAAMSHPVLIK